MSSGINNREMMVQATCPHEDCDFEDELEVTTDGNVWWAECPKCYGEMEGWEGALTWPLLAEGGE